MSTTAPRPLSTHLGVEEIIALRVLTTLGVDLPKTARILDFGCGAGKTVGALRHLGFVNASGNDVVQSRHDLVYQREHIRVGTALNLKLPYDDNTFDLVMSD